MKKILVLSISFLSVMFFVSSVLAYTYYPDTYTGSTEGVNLERVFNDADVIAGTQWVADNIFEIDGIQFDISDDVMTVGVETDFYHSFGSYGIDYGDLFIDDTSTDIEWDYVFDTSGKKLYDISDAQDQIVYSNDVGATKGWNPAQYRPDEEVLIDPTGLTAIGDGTTTGFTYGARSEDFIWMSFDITGMNLNPDSFSLVLHWTQTCGNDVIEERVPTPEPATMLLLGFGLIALAMLRKRFSS